MISKQLQEAADELKRLIDIERDQQLVPESFHHEIRNICQELLDTANVKDYGGCSLCQA